MQADNDRCFTDNSDGPERNVEELQAMLQAYLDSLKESELVIKHLTQSNAWCDSCITS